MKIQPNYGRDIMDDELKQYIDETWGRYEAALMEKDSKLALKYAIKSSWENKINEFMKKAEIDK